MRTASTAPAPTTSGQPAAYPQSRLDCEYTSCYCEENIYRLTQRLQEQPEQLRGELFVVFLSNPQRMASCPASHQPRKRCAKLGPDGL
mmetsp:Transcript_23043/g.57885  ORF Transcript_23043/g.57885 Transcript_23043/m.57885 type:complete len:88 (-) Transcript_23043:790-1053(-)